MKLFIVDVEIGRRLHFERLKELKDACTARNFTQHFDIQQQVGFTSNLLQSFKAHFGEFRERTILFKFITHPHECAVEKPDLSFIPDVSIRKLELEVADLKALDMWVKKLKSLNKDLEILARQQAQMDKNEKTSICRPVDSQNLERVSSHIRHTVEFVYCRIYHVWLHVSSIGCVIW